MQGFCRQCPEQLAAVSDTGKGVPCWYRSVAKTHLPVWWFGAVLDPSSWMVDDSLALSELDGPIYSLKWWVSSVSIVATPALTQEVSGIHIANLQEWEHDQKLLSR